MLEALGDEYISQHVLQSYHDYLEQTGYKVYMSNKASEIVAALCQTEPHNGFQDILDELNEGLRYAKPQTESEEDIKSRMLKKLHGKEGA